MMSSPDYSIELKRPLRAAFSGTKTAVLAVAAALLLWGIPAPTFGNTAETCPGATTPAAEFTWTTSAWTADGPSAGISVWGDSMLARWSTTGAPIAAVVITAGTVTINYTYDPVALQGAVAATDVEAAAGAPLAHLGFCTGPSTNPTSGSGISVGVTKTASCAVVNADQTATVQGTITVVRHKPEQDPVLPRVAIRIRTTRDTIFAGDGSILGEETTIAGLTGFVMASETDTVAVPYHVTFSPGAADAFSNKIEITIENATSGLDRHKYYSASAAFGLCQVGAATPTPTPTPEQSQAPAQSHSPEGSVKAVVGSPPTSIPNTAFASPPSLPTSVVFFALLMLSSLGTLGLATVRVVRKRPRK
jgi:hypothetical protein